MRLVLGSGLLTQQLQRRGWTCLDNDPECKPDILTTVPPLPLLPEPLDCVRAIHFWEHLYYWDALDLAHQIYRELVPFGKLIIEVPNLLKGAEYLLHPDRIPTKPKRPYVNWTEYVFYGPQSEDRYDRNPYQTHKYGYTPDWLIQQMVKAGFKRDWIRIKKARFHLREHRDFRLEATKDV